MVRRQETGQGRRVHRDHRQTDRVPAWLYLSFQSCQRCCLLQEVLSLTRLSQAAPLGTPCLGHLGQNRAHGMSFGVTQTGIEVPVLH